VFPPHLDNNHFPVVRYQLLVPSQRLINDSTKALTTTARRENRQSTECDVEPDKRLRTKTATARSHLMTGSIYFGAPTILALIDVFGRDRTFPPPIFLIFGFVSIVHYTVHSIPQFWPRFVCNFIHFLAWFSEFFGINYIHLSKIFMFRPMPVLHLSLKLAHCLDIILFLFIQYLNLWLIICL
jgi:hypothetical protein